VTQAAEVPARTYVVRLDERRRPTLPPALLAAAGIASDAHDLVARVAGPGRVVLEDPQAMLASLQDDFAAARRVRGVHVDPVEELLSERRDAPSL
jgi:hypothetical protein